MDAEVRADIKSMIQEDLKMGDVTTESVVDESVESQGEIIAGENGFIAGIPEIIFIFEQLEVVVNNGISDGDEIEAGDLLAKVSGPAHGILAAERVALNLISRMSGVATATKEMISKAEQVNPDVKIAATRKTIPLMRKFDKRAVKVVGGEPHRYHLGDFVLIKDNHLKLDGSVPEAVKRARYAGLSEKIEIEVTNKQEAISAAEAGADIVMLDNFEPEGARETIEALERADLRSEVTIESSGGIVPSNVKDYAATKVDVISSSYMTMQAPALDIKLDIRGQESGS